MGGTKREEAMKESTLAISLLCLGCFLSVDKVHGSDGTCDPEQIVSSTSYACPGGPEKSNSRRCSQFPATNILSMDDDDKWHGSIGNTAIGHNANYWLAEDGKVGEEQGFIMNLGCSKTVSSVSLKNTHNGRHRDRSTKKFRILGSTTNNGPWQELLVANLEDSRQQDPPPLQQLMFANSAVVSFIKFELLEFYGRYGGGLQYFAVAGSGVAASPNYPANYPHRLGKTEVIEVKEGLVISLRFNAFDIEFHSTCKYDNLKIIDGVDGSTLMEKSCGSTKKSNGILVGGQSIGTTLPADITSTSNIVKLVFKTDKSVTRSGWSVSWSAVISGG